MRSFTVMFSTLTMALAALGLAVAAPRHQDFATVDLARAGGALQISNSHAGQSLFTAGEMRPGEGVSGTVRIGNAGDIAGRFGVRTVGLEDAPGPYGGRLSDRLELVLFDVTDVQQPVTLYAGHPSDFGEIDLGTFAAGESREYVLAATLPNGGLSGTDNQYQGASLRLGFQWRAGTVAAPTPVPTATPKPKPKPVVTPTPTPAAPASPVVTADMLGLPSAKSCVKRGRLKFRLKTPAGVRIVSATVAVDGRVKARLKGAKLRKPVSLKRLRKRAKVKVTLRASNRRTYTATRAYRSCKS